MDRETTRWQGAGFKCPRCGAEVLTDGIQMVCEDECGYKAFFEKQDMSPTADIKPILNVHDTIKLKEDHSVHWWEKLWLKINGHKSTLCFVGMIAGGILAIIPVTALLGKGIFALSVGGEGASLLHREGKASKFGKLGEFNMKNLLEVVMSIVRAIVQIFSLKKKGG